MQRPQIDRFGIWAEGCYSMTGNSDTSDYSQRLSRIDYTIGFDFSYGPQDDYYLDLQYTGTVIPGFDYSANTNVSNPQVYYERMLVGLLGSETEKMTQGITWNTHRNLASGAVIPKFTGSLFSFPVFYDNSSETRYGNMFLQPEMDFMPGRFIPCPDRGHPGVCLWSRKVGREWVWKPLSIPWASILNSTISSSAFLTSGTTGPTK